MKKSKMTPKQIQHYLKGGKFSATYNPKRLAVVSNNESYIGSVVTAYQNIIITPIVETESYLGQHTFNVENIFGWVPEEDLDNLVILEDEFIESIEPLPQFIYIGKYIGQKAILESFGKRYEHKQEMSVGRSYANEMDDYVLDMMKHATEITKAVYTGKTEDLVWTVLKS